VNKIIVALGAGVGAIVTYVDSWGAHVWTLVTIMCIDFVVGTLMPLLFGKSKKSKAGKLESYACRRGIVKKCVMFLMIYVSWLLGRAANVTFLPDAVCTALIVSEVISILEHAAVLGVPIPRVLLRALSAINDKAGEGVNILANGSTDSQSNTLNGVKDKHYDSSQSTEDK